MKKTVAMNWINALRSGEYKQTIGCLYGDGGYCCLGVLNKLYPELELDRSFTADNNINRVIIPGYTRIGLHGAGGELEGCEDVSLAYLNDAGYTFDEIADIIQIEYVEGL